MDKLANNERENSASFGVTDLKGSVSDVGYNTLNEGTESDSRQRLILSLLKSKTQNSAFTIPKINRDEKLPLSWSQQQLWLISRLDAQASRAYHISLVIKFKGTINAGLLNEAYKIIIDRHEILRTNIRVDGFGDPYQYINTEHACSIEEIYLENSLNGDDKVHAYNKLVSELISAPFDLEFSSPIRASLIWLDNNSCSLLIVLHHIVSDAWSLGCFTRELSAQYNAFLQGQKSPLKALPIQYADYAAWQRGYLQDEKLIKDMTYWKDRLHNVPVLSLPTDRLRPSVPSYKGARVDFILDAALAQGLKSIGVAQGSTMFMTLLGIFKVLLNRYTDQSDICIGTPIANRTFDELAPLIGYFVNTLALRSFINPSESFVDTLKQIKAVTLSAFEHQILPFEKVVESVRPERSQSYSPIFQVMMVFQNVGGLDARLVSTEVEYENPTCTTSKLDLTLFLEEVPNGSVLGSIEYSTDLFDKRTMERFKAHFIELSRAILASPTKPLSEVEFLTLKEKHQLLVEWNDTAAPYPKEKCIHELFEEQVASAPEAVAVVFGGQQLTYGELNARANQLARYLIGQRKVKPDTLVGICVERSLEMIIAILGILKAGGAYVPLDPDYPQSRLQYMLEDASLGTVITQQHLQDKTQIAEGCAVYIDDAELQEELSTISASNIVPGSIELTSSHLAYVIYTSGSTGKSKGVMIEHCAVINYLAYVLENYVENITISTVSSNVVFDATLTSLFGGLLKGIKTEFLAQGVKEFELLKQRITDAEEQSLFKITPAHLTLLSNELIANESNKIAHYFIIGGEQLSSKLILQFKEKLLVNSVFVNEYGPTETVVGCSTFFVREKHDVDCINASVFIGRPIKNTQLYILNVYGKQVPIGVAGELYIGGAGLARGYLNRPELTAEKFISNPFHDPTNPVSSDRLYKTGDLCRYLPDGNIEFLGRIDHQVKIRGFRIELGEIESALISHELVKDAVVLARENKAGDKQLVAFIVCGAAIPIADLKAYLSKQLPNYMIPSAVMVLGALPLTPNGKVDRKALEFVSVELEGSAGYVAPRTKLEHQLVEIWSSILSLDIGNIGIHDNLFNLGASSISIIALNKKINDICGNLITNAFAFEYQTIEDQSAAIEKIKKSKLHDDLNIKTKHLNIKPEQAYRNEAKKNGITRSIIAVYENGKMLSYDMDLRDYYGSNNANARFFIGCIDKVLITYLMLSVAERNIIDLDCPIKDIDPESYSKVDEKITLKTLLSHTSGLDISSMEHLKIKYDVRNFKEENKLVNLYPQISSPGSVFSYSYLGMLVSISIVEKILNTDYVSAINKYVLEPLDINPIDLTNKSYSGKMQDDSNGKLITIDNNNLEKNINGYIHIELSAMDLLKISVVAINDGRTIDNKNFINKKYSDLLIRNQITFSGYYYYGGWSLGWFQYPSSNIYGYISGSNGHHNCIAIDVYRKKIVVVQADIYPAVDYFDFVLKNELKLSLHRGSNISPDYELSSTIGSYAADGLIADIMNIDGKYNIRSKFKKPNGEWSEEVKGEIRYSEYGNYVVRPRIFPYLNLITFHDEHGDGNISHVSINDMLLRKRN